ncbi:MAG: CHAT domain-containing protein [Burkholderiaceae bacterium]
MWLLALVPAMAQAPEPAASPLFDAARARLADAETLRALSADGQLLYQRDRVKLDGAMYCAQSSALSEKGEFRLGIEAASKALMLGQTRSDQHLVAAAKRDLAIAYSYAGDLDQAERYAQDSLSEGASDKADIAAPGYKTLGDIAVRRGKLPEAIVFFSRAQAAASDRFRPLVTISLANAYLTDGRIAQARLLYDDLALPANGALRQAYQRGIGNLLLAEGKTTASIAAFTQAAESASGSDAAYHQLWASEGIARGLLKQGDRAGARRAYVAAVRASEAVRARFRSEEFKTGLFGDVQQIFDRAISLTMQDGDVEGAWRLSEESRSRALLDIVRERVRTPTATSGGLISQAPDLAAMRQVLRPGEAMIAFHSLDDRLLAWVVRPDGISGTTITQKREDIAVLVERFRTAVFTRSKGVDMVASELYAILLAPLQLRPEERLLIVPHGALHYLPFQALRDDDAYLIERHALAISPSASVAVQLARRTVATGGKLVAFGNPGTVAALALPGAEREVNQIATLFGDSQVFLQAEASKRQFRASAGNATILHVAAHAEVDVVDPLQSRILLAPDGKPDDLDSGFLLAREVYEVDLGDVALVTISACESGLGRIARGDEILGFTRSFFSAGASALIVSLWPVGDNSTAVLMQSLYRQLAAGDDAVMAMQTAQKTVLSQPRFRHPFFWAPFNLIGDWHMRIAPSAAGAQHAQ